MTSSVNRLYKSYSEISRQDRSPSYASRLRTFTGIILDKLPQEQPPKVNLKAMVCEVIGDPNIELENLTPAVFAKSLLRWAENQVLSIAEREKIVEELFQTAFPFLADSNNTAKPTLFFKVFAELFVRHPFIELPNCNPLKGFPEPSLDSCLTEEELEILSPLVELIVENLTMADSEKIKEAISPLLKILREERGPKHYTTTIGVHYTALLSNLKDRLDFQWISPLSPQEKSKHSAEIDLKAPLPEFGMGEKFIPWAIALTQHLAFGNLGFREDLLKAEAEKVTSHLLTVSNIKDSDDPIALYWHEMRSLTTQALIPPYYVLSILLPYVLKNIFRDDAFDKINKLPNNPKKDFLVRCILDHQRLNLITRNPDDFNKFVEYQWNQSKASTLIDEQQSMMSYLDTHLEVGRTTSVRDYYNPTPISADSQLAEMASSLLIMGTGKLTEVTPDTIAYRIILLSERIAALPRILPERRRIELARAIIELTNVPLCIRKKDLMCHRLTETMFILLMAFPEVADVAEVLQTIVKEFAWQLPMLDAYSSPKEIERFYMARGNEISSGERLKESLNRFYSNCEEIAHFANPLGQFGEWAIDYEPHSPLVYASHLYPGSSPLLFTESDVISYAKSLHKPLHPKTFWAILNNTLHDISSRHYTSSHLQGGSLFKGRWINKPLVPLSKYVTQVALTVLLRDNPQVALEYGPLASFFKLNKYRNITQEESLALAKTGLKKLLNAKEAEETIAEFFKEVKQLGKTRRGFIAAYNSGKIERFNLRTLLSQALITRVRNWGSGAKTKLISQVSLTEIAMLIRYAFRSDPLLMPLVNSGMLSGKIGDKQLPPLVDLPINFAALLIAVAITGPNDPITLKTLKEIDAALLERYESLYFFLKKPVLHEPFNVIAPLKAPYEFELGVVPINPSTPLELVKPLEDIINSHNGKPFWPEVDLIAFIRQAKHLLKVDPMVSLVNTTAWLLGGRKSITNLCLNAAEQNMSYCLESYLNPFFDCLFFLSEGFEEDRHPLCQFMVESLSGSKISHMVGSNISHRWIDLFQREDSKKEILNWCLWLLGERLPAHQRFHGYMAVEIMHRLHYTQEKRSEIIKLLIDVKGWKKAEEAFDLWFYNEAPYPELPTNDKQFAELLNLLAAAGLTNREEQFQFLYLIWPRRVCRASKMTSQQLAKGTKRVHKALEQRYFELEEDKIAKIREDIQKSLITGWFDPDTQMQVPPYGKRFLEMYNIQGSLFDLLMSLTDSKSDVTIQLDKFPKIKLTIPSQSYEDLKRPLAEFESVDGNIVRCGSIIDLDFKGKGLNSVTKAVENVTGTNAEAFQLILAMLSQSIANLFHSAINRDPAMLSYVCTEEMRFFTEKLNVKVYQQSPTRLDMYVKATTVFKGISTRSQNQNDYPAQRPFPNTQIEIELPVAIVTDNLLRTRLEVFPEECSFKLLFQ